MLTITSFLWKFICLQRYKFILFALLSFIWTLDMTFWPYFLRLIVDTLNAYDTNRESVWPILKQLLLLGAFFWVSIEAAFRGRDFLQSSIFPKFEAKIRMTMFDHVQRHSPKYFNEHFSGSLANKIENIAAEVSEPIKTLLTIIIPALVSCIVIVLIFAAINPFFAGIVGIWIAAHAILCSIFIPKCIHYSHLHGEERSSLIGKIVDSLTNNFTVNLFFRFDFEKHRIAMHQKVEQAKNRFAQLYTAKMLTCLSCAFIIEMFALTGFMIFYWIQGKISTGEIVQLFYTVWNLSMLIWWVASVAPQFFQSFGVAKQALSIMNDPQDLLDLPEAVALQAHLGEIIFENVSFRYGSKQLFQNKNLRIKAGERIGLVGYSGAGKSSLINLLLRFYPLEKGKILIDGQDIAKVTLKSLREQTTLIPQDPLLFHRSLEDNIRYGKEDATHEEVIHAAKLAHCDEFIQKRPDGYATLVGERGTKLSGGERQRIAIARALLTKTPILILDEATSALDSVTEELIQQSLEILMKNRTTLVIAHRLSTLCKMDRILVFDHGKIIEEGSHQELLAKQGLYAHMWKCQAGGFLPEKP